MPDKVFISYSRKDIDFARQLFVSLEKTGRDAWIDWEDIPYSVDWWKEICTAIEQAETFIFIVSPASLASEICNKEVDYARSLNKRIIPVVHQNINEQEMILIWFNKSWETSARENWASLERLNWLFFRDTDDFETAFVSLIRTVETDIDHLRSHTRLLVRAKEWQDNHKNDSFLLQGDDLQEAEHWLVEASDKDPKALDLHKIYIVTSREVEDRRLQQTELMGRRVRQFRRASAVLGVIGVLALIAALFAIDQQNRARLEASAAATAQNEAVNQAAQATIAQGQAVIGQQTSVAEAVTAQTQAAVIAQTLTPIPRTLTPVQLTLTAGSAQIAVAQNQVQQAGETLTPLPVTLTLAANRIITANAQAEEAQLRADQANATLTMLPVTLTPIAVTLTAGADQLTTAQAELGAAQDEAQNAQIEISRAQNLINDFGETLTPLPATLTPIAITLTAGADQLTMAQAALNSANEFVATAQTQVAVVAQTLTPMQQAIEVAQSEAEARGQLALMRRLTGDALTLSSEQLDLSLLLSLEALRLADQTKQERGIALDRLVNALGSNLQIERYFHITPENHNGIYPANAVAFSTDGTMLAAAGDEHIKLWDVSNGSLIFEIETFDCYYSSIAFRPDNTQIAAACDFGGETFVWDIATQEQIARLRGEGATGIYAIAYSPDGQWLATAIDTGEMSAPADGVRLYDTTNYAEAAFMPIDGQAMAIAFYPNSSLLFAGKDRSGNLVKWDVPNGRPQTFDMGGSILDTTGLAFSPDGRYLAVNGDPQQIVLVNNPYEPIYERILNVGEADTGTQVAFSPDSRYAAFVDEDSINIVDTENPERTVTSLKGHTNLVSSVAFNPNGRLIASASWDGTVILWDWQHTRGRQWVLTDAESHYYNDIAYSADSQRMILCTDTEVIIFDRATGAEIARRQFTLEPQQQITQIGANADGSIVSITIFTSGGDTSNYHTLFWHVGTERIDMLPTGSIDAVFSPTQNLMAASDFGADHNVPGAWYGVRLWDVETLEMLGEIETGYDARFSADGQRLYVQTAEAYEVWDMANFTQIEQYGIPEMVDLSYYEPAYSPQNNLVAIGDYPEGGIILMDVTNGQQFGSTLSSHVSSVFRTAFSPDGRLLVSIDEAGVLIMWDVETGQPLGQPMNTVFNTDHYPKMLFTSDGRELAILSSAGIQFLSVGEDMWKATACYVANRTLSSAELRDYFGDATRIDICAGSPLLEINQLFLNLHRGYDIPQMSES